MFAFVTIVEPQIDSLNTARKGALKSHIFGAPKVGSRKRVGSVIAVAATAGKSCLVLPAREKRPAQFQDIAEVGRIPT